MKNILKRIAATALAFVLVFSGINAINAQAKETGTKDAQKYNSNTYNYVVEDFSRLVTGKECSIEVYCYTQRLKLSGYGNAGKKINKALKKLITVDPDNIFGYAESDVKERSAEYIDQYFDYCDSWVAYNDGKVISVKIHRAWFAGGVSNTWNDGYTFSLETGKRVPITTATGWSLTKIKQRLLANIAADGEEDAETTKIINNMKESDFKYYLKEGNQCIVTFGAYELGYGGWSREYIIEFK